MKNKFIRWPDSWEVKKLGQICEINIGKTPKRNNPSYWGGEHVWLTIGDIHGKYISDSKEKVTDLAISENQVKLVKKGTVILSFKLTIGKVAITTKDLFTNEAIVALPIKEKYIDRILINYLFWALQAVPLETESVFAVKGKTLNKSSLSNINLPIPGLPEQNRIVSRIESLSSEVERAKKLHSSIVKDTKQLMASVLLKLIPNPYLRETNGFSYIPLNELTTEKNQQIRPGDTPDKEFNYWGLDAIDAEEFQEPAKNIVKGNEIRSTNITFLPGQVLYCKLRPYLNKVISTTMEGIGSTEWVVFQPETKKISPDYLANVMRSRWFVKTIMRSTTGARMPRARKSVLRKMLIPVPAIVGTEDSLHQQNLIVQKIKIVNKLMIDMKKTLDIQIDEFESLQQSILSQAFKGEL